MDKNKINSLHSIAQFTLFISSYLPLFILIIARQVSENYSYLNWGGINVKGIDTFFIKFGLSFFLSLMVLIGWYGFRKTLNNIEEVAKNGFPVTIKDVKNKNSEAIGYIATYIIPFLFQGFNGWFECLSVLFLLAIIYRIYINSSLLLINPFLSIWYSIYEVEFKEGTKNKNGLIISRDKYLQEEEEIKLYEIGYKLYFAININNQ